jgi:hypothetical protein
MTWLLVTVPAFVAAAVALAKLIPGLVRAVRASRVAAVPLASEMRVRLDAQGPLELAMEARRFSRDFAGVGYSLSRDGQDVPMRRLVFRTQVSGVEKVRLSLYTFDATPGDYLLRATGVGEAGTDSAVVFVRPLGAALVGYVLGLVVAGAALIGSIVASALILMAQR